MSVDLNLPTFGLDCRDWLVATEAEGLLVDESESGAVVAILSTAVICGTQLASAQAVLSLALIDEASPAGTDVAPTTQIEWAGQDIYVLDADWAAGYARFAVAVPGGELAVVAEFTSAPDPGRELVDRFYDLVTSFRWAA